MRSGFARSSSITRDDTRLNTPIDIPGPSYPTCVQRWQSFASRSEPDDAGRSVEYGV
jgi:hypothetical protein